FQCNSSGIVIYDLESGEVYQKADGYQVYAENVYFDESGKLIYFIGMGEYILEADLLVWDVENGEIYKTVTTPSRRRFSWGALSPSGADIAVIYSVPFREEHVVLGFIDTQSWEIERVDENNSPEYIEYCNAASIMATKDYSLYFSFRNADDGTILQTIDVGDDIVSITFSPDCNLVYVLTFFDGLFVFGI
ncbi:MAG: hypothetical protein JXB38_02410, partial [Anaerolineales bacterium]|nr:hypothetical protein [Anaerolineales bacterium]